MTSHITGIAITRRDAALEARISETARQLYDAEVALHIAHQSRVDAWVVAASDRLHEAVVGYLAAAAERDARSAAHRMSSIAAVA